MKRISRRRFLQTSSWLAGILVGPGGSSLLGGCTNQPPVQPTPPGPQPTPTTAVTSAPVPTNVPVISLTAPTATASASKFVPDLELALKATQGQVQILPGKPTNVWTYQGAIMHGDPDSLQPLANTYLGPLIRLKKGQKVRVHFTNDLPERSIVHWHGLLVPSRMDGHPRDEIKPGQTYVYEFEVLNRAGTYWFHPHPEPLTGSQVIRGLAGLFVVSDDEEAATGLPSGPYDVPIVIQDRTFDQDNQFVYVKGDSMPGMVSMERLMGFLGDRILVNGQITPLLPVATTAYRLRFLNGSNSRVYKLAWSHGAPLTVIATDGGLLERPTERPYVMLGPGERIDVWADFSQFPVGAEFLLQSLAFLGAEGDRLIEGSGTGTPAPAPTAQAETMPGMNMEHGAANANPTATPMPGMDMQNMGTPSGPNPTPMPGMGVTPAPTGAGTTGGMENYNPALPNGAPFPILRVRVEREVQQLASLPTQLSSIQRYRPEDAANAQDPRRFELSMRNSQWLINGRSFQMEEVAPDEVFKLNSLTAWEFVNGLNLSEPMEKMGMVHPMHIHGVQFQVASREMAVPQLQAGWDSVHEGFVDEGWKDTVLVMPGERVRLLMKFAFPDLFLYHCHNLEHEDLGMMRNYRAVD